MKDALPQNRHTKEEKELLKKLNTDFDAAKHAKMNSCYWDATTTGEVNDTSGSGGGNWNDRVDTLDKMFLNWFEKPSLDEFESNVKSPMSSGRIDSTMQKLRRVDLRFVARPTDTDDPKDKRKAGVIEELLNQLFLKGNFRYRLLTAFKESLYHPVSFLHIYYMSKKRKCRFAKTSVKNMSKKEQKDLKAGKKVYEEKEFIEYDDIAIEPVKFNEIYPDPSARCLHGSSYEAQYIIRRMLPSYDQFKAMFEGDKDAKNVDKVRAASVYGDEDLEFFEPPRDIEDDDYVEVLFFYYKNDDRYVIKANDVVIKDMPLPFDHKQLPFVKFHAIEHPHQFYHISIPDRLMAIQAEEEILKNTLYDRLHLTANPLRKVKKTIYGEYSKAWQQARGGGALLPVNNLEDEAPVEFPTMSFDMFRALDQLGRDASLATQIDPVQMGVMQKYVAATTSMMTKEQMDSFINGLIDGYTESLSIAAYQIVALMKQYYTVPRVRNKLGKDAKVKKVRLEGIEINQDTLEVTQKGTRDYSFFDVKPEYFDISGDWDITLSPESVEVISKAIEMQKSQANIAQLAPFMADPSNSTMMQQHPMPWVDGPRTLAWYAETNNIPENLLVQSHEDEDIAIKRAELQGKAMMAGEEIYGVPGESDVHKKVHVKQLQVVNKKVKELEEELGAMGPMMEIYMPVLPQGQELDKQKELARSIAEHLQEDDMPPTMIEEMATEKTLAPPEVPMPPGLTPAGSAQPPMPGGGNQQSGMMGEPQMGGPGGQTGAPPEMGPPPF